MLPTCSLRFRGEPSISDLDGTKSLPNGNSFRFSVASIFHEPNKKDGSDGASEPARQGHDDAGYCTVDIWDDDRLL